MASRFYSMAVRRPSRATAFARLTSTRSIKRIPASHVEFLKGWPPATIVRPISSCTPESLPLRQLEEQSVEDMLWIRQEFIFHPHQTDATVVFGHTPMRAVMVDLPYKLGIDTGLVYGGKLTCLEFTEGVAYQVARGSRQAKAQSIELA